MRKSIFFLAVFICCFAQSLVVGQNNAHSQNNNNGGQTEQSKTNQNVTITEPIKVLLESDREQIEAEKGYKARQEKRDETNAAWNRAGIIINSLLFVLVLIQALFSYRALLQVQRQASIMETQAKLMEASLEETRRTISENNRTFQIGNRAYLGAKRGKLKQPVEVEQPIEAEIEFVNKGNTPAFVINSTTGIYFFKPKRFKLPRLRPKKRDFGSSGSVSKDGDINFIVKHSPIDEKKMDSFKKGELWLYVWGAFEYKDVFGESHQTNFCVFQAYDGDEDKTRLGIYSKGNDAT